MKKTELPEQIKYYIKNIRDKKTPKSLRKNYMIALSDCHEEIEKTLKEYQLEIYDFRNR